MIDSTIARYVTLSGPESDEVERELVEHGVDVLPCILPLIRSRAPDSWRLTDLLTRLEDPRIVSPLLTELRVGFPELTFAASKVLARMGGPGVFEFFAEQFERGLWASTAPFLARLGDRRAVPLLRDKLADLVGDHDDSETVWALLDAELDRYDDPEERILVADEQDAIASVVEALARLGDFTRVRLVDSLHDYPKASKMLRQAAGRAAQAAIGRGTFALACRGIADPDEEVRFAFVEALYFLGAKGVATALAERLEIETVDDTRLVGHIERRLGDLVGNWAPAAARAIDATLVDGVCHRNGAPIDYAELARLAATDDDFAKHELYLRTGGIVGWIDFPMKRLPPERRLAEAEAWIANEAPKFERGAHYRAGVRRHI